MKAPIQQFQKAYVKYIESLSDDKRKKIVAYIYISLTLLTVSFFGLFAISPTLSTVANLQKQYEDDKLVLDALNKKLSSLTTLDAQYREIQSDIQNVYAAIPRSPNIPYLTRQLENIAKDSNVLIGKLDFGTIELFPNKKNESIYSFNFSISVVGSENGINSFIETIINFDRIVGIDKITTGKSQGNSEASIIGRVYFSK